MIENNIDFFLTSKFNKRQVEKKLMERPLQ